MIRSNIIGVVSTAEKIGIVIPTYNERENILILIPRIFEICKKNRINASVLVVDDNSPDGTALVAKNLGKKFPVDVIVRGKKLGIGSAYIVGFEKFLNKNVDAIIQMDADISHDPKYIPNMLKKLRSGCDIIVGSRYVKGGARKNWGMHRKLISRGQNILTKIFLDMPVKDVTSGYRIYKTNALHSIDLRKIKSRGFSFQVEILYKLISKGFSVYEIPIKFSNRKFGKSKLSMREILDSVKTLARLKQK